MHLQVRLKRGDVGDLNVRQRARASIEGRAPWGVNSGKRRRFDRCWERAEKEKDYKLKRDKLRGTIETIIKKFNNIIS
jgi:hypothetical protein